MVAFVPFAAGPVVVSVVGSKRVGRREDVDGTIEDGRRQRKSDGFRQETGRLDAIPLIRRFFLDPLLPLRFVDDVIIVGFI